MGNTKRFRRPKEMMTTIRLSDRQVNYMKSIKKYNDEPIYDVLQRILDSYEELELAQMGNQNLRKRIEVMAHDIDEFILAVKTHHIPMFEGMMLSDDTRYRLKREGINFIKLKDNLTR